MSVTPQLRAEVIRDVLDAGEQRLILRHTAGKSLDALAQLYPHLEGPNGVQRRLNEITAKVETALDERRNGSLARLAQQADDDDNSGGIIIRHAASNGTGAVPAKPSTAPPSRPAPVPSSSPSPPVLDTPRPSPPRPPTPPATASRDAQVLELLREEPRSAANIAQTLAVQRTLIVKALARLKKREAAEPTSEASYDYERTGKGGPPATVWRIAGDTRTCSQPAPTSHPTSPAARDHATERAEKVLTILRGRATSRRALRDALSETSHNIRFTLEELQRDGRAFPTQHSARDWVGTDGQHGRPSVIWQATGGPHYLAPVKTYPVVDMPSIPRVMQSPSTAKPSPRGDGDVLTRGEALALVALARERTTNLFDDLEALLRG